jgi:hypothetical protein
MRKYFCMSSDEALRFLKARANGEEPNLNEYVRIVGQGGEPDLAPIKALETKIAAIQKRFPRVLKDKDPAGGKFETQACEVVHQALEGVEPTALADLDFWTWLAVARFASTVEWRFGAKGGKHAKPANYGIGSRSENLLFRLWLRAELVKDSSQKDPYLLAKTGDQDLWRSHILRQGYANARLVTKALLKLQAGQLKAKRLAVDGIRDLAKRLRRMRANLEFEFLTATQADDLVSELSEGLKAAK